MDTDTQKLVRLGILRPFQCDFTRNVCPVGGQPTLFGVDLSTRRWLDNPNCSLCAAATTFLFGRRNFLQNLADTEKRFLSATFDFTRYLERYLRCVEAVEQIQTRLVFSICWSEWKKEVFFFAETVCTDFAISSDAKRRAILIFPIRNFVHSDTRSVLPRKWPPLCSVVSEGVSPWSWAFWRVTLLVITHHKLHYGFQEGNNPVTFPKGTIKHAKKLNLWVSSFLSVCSLAPRNLCAYVPTEQYCHAIAERPTEMISCSCARWFPISSWQHHRWSLRMFQSNFKPFLALKAAQKNFQCNQRCFFSVSDHQRFVS